MKTKETKIEETAVVNVPTPKPIDTPESITELWDLINKRLTAIEEKLETKIKTGNGRGPSSTRAMNEEDAKKIMTGDLKDTAIKTCAAELGLSYGQIYSARGGYTFKTQYAERLEMVKKEKAEKKQ